MAGLSYTQSRSLLKLRTKLLVPGAFEAVTGRRSASTGTITRATEPEKERVVILGSGWAGYALARTLSPSKYSRALISPRSHFVFTPLLASAAVGTLEFRATIEPVRRLGLAEFHQAWASDIDLERKTIRVQAAPGPVGDASVLRDAPGGKEFDVEFDKLVLAVGCYSQTFGIEGVTEHASFLRDVGDARAIRLRVLAAFEKASLPTTSDKERAKLLHFAIVGGGPTGIEFAAELHDLVHEDLARLYPSLMQYVAVTIYDIAPKVLPMFDQNLANYATDMFRRQGIQVRTEHHLTRVRRDGDTLMLHIKEEPEEVGAGIVVWSTGLMQNPLVGKLLSQKNGQLGSLVKDPKTGGLVTDEHLRVQAHGPEGTTTRALPDVFAIGDCAVVEGHRYPATAQVASQQALYLGKQLNRKKPDADGAGAGAPFKFRDWGTMAYLGSHRAIHQSKADELKGRAAWILWRAAYMTMSMSIRNKIMIPMYWVITWIFGRDISRF